MVCFSDILDGTKCIAKVAGCFRSGDRNSVA